jgi:hypothetical protein
MSWKELIPGCFGPFQRNLSYAGVKRDKERAEEMVKAANKEKVTKSEFEAAMRDYMLTRGTELQFYNLQAHIEAEMKYVLRKNFVKGTSKILERV